MQEVVELDTKDIPFKNTITISEKVGCGHIYAIIQLKNKSFDRVDFLGAMPKSCDCGDSFLQALSKILTFAIRRAIKEGNIEIALLKHLTGQRCNKPIYRGAVSCTDAIAKLIRKYMELENGKKKETNKN
jgi:hypothetical protein